MECLVTTGLSPSQSLSDAAVAAGVSSAAGFAGGGDVCGIAGMAASQRIAARNTDRELMGGNVTARLLLSRAFEVAYAIVRLAHMLELTVHHGLDGGGQ